MSPDLALADTNVLVYAHFKDADQHAASKSLLDQAQSGAVALCPRDFEMGGSRF